MRQSLFNCATGYLLLLMCLAAPSITSAVERDRWTPSDDDLRILEVRVDKYFFEDAIPAYQREDVILLPLGTLSDLLDLAIEIEPGFARGFVVDEDYHLVLDLSRNEILLPGGIQQYDPDLVHESFGDIYVESNLLSGWLQMNLEIDLFGALVKVTPSRPLPFMQRQEREERMRRANSRVRPKDPGFPRHYEAYRLASVPFFDQTLRLSSQTGGDSGTATDYQYSGFVTADLLRHESNWFLSTSKAGGVEDIRVSLARRDPEGGLLGVLNAGEYAFGSVAEVATELISRSGDIQPGFLVSNIPGHLPTEFDRHRFRGDLRQGWEAELYQNNTLIAYQQDAVDGLYDFKDVPLLFGYNHFRLVHYGPEGQVQEEEYHFQLGENMIRKGERYYRFMVSDADQGSYRLTSQFDLGLTSRNSLSLHLVSIPLPEDRGYQQHNYLSTSLRGFADNLFYSLKLIGDAEDGQAAEVSFQTRLGSTIIGYEDLVLTNFVSEEFLPGRLTVKRRSSLLLDSAITLGNLPRLPLRLDIKREEFENSQHQLTISNDLSFNARGYAIRNRLQRQKIDSSDAVFNGALQVSTNISQNRFRGTLNYDIEPDVELLSATLSFDHPPGKNYQLSYSLNHSLDRDLTEFGLQLSRSTGKVRGNLTTRYNTNNEFRMDIALSMGFGYEPRHPSWISQPGSIANQGSVSAQVFLDHDQDGIFGQGDEPLQGVGFTLNGAMHRKVTDDSGILFITGLDTRRFVNVAIAAETLVDPLWTTAIEGVRITPRAGRAIQLDFPVFMSGEIDGTVSLEAESGNRGIGDVSVELIDHFGRVLMTTKTAYDGFYIFSQVPLGDYAVRVALSQLGPLGLSAESVPDVVINDAQLFESGVDLLITGAQQKEQQKVTDSVDSWQDSERLPAATYWLLHHSTVFDFSSAL